MSTLLRDFVQRALRIAGIDIDPSHAGAVDGDVEALAQRVERGGAHAVVGGQPGDRDLVDPPLAQQRRQVRPVEARVALGLRVRALVDDDVDALARDRGVQLGARRSRDAVRRPRPALAFERAVVGGMPVARGHDEVEAPRVDQLTQARADLVAARHRQRPAGHEVVLDVDDDQGLGHPGLAYGAMAVLPQALRRAVPTRVRDDVRLRAVAVGAGLIPPRTMHSAAERSLLQRLARGVQRVVEIGVYEGSSAVAICEVLGPEAELHLIDPFGHHPTALPAGWGATERASRRVVARAARRGGPRVVWHIELSEQAARSWTLPADLVFIDGDHAEDATRRDWEDWHRHVVPGGHVLFHDAR